MTKHNLYRDLFKGLDQPADGKKKDEKLKEPEPPKSPPPSNEILVTKYLFESRIFKGYTEIRLGNRTSYVKTDHLPAMKAALVDILGDDSSIGFTVSLSEARRPDVRKGIDYVAFLFEGERKSPDYPNTERREVGNVECNVASEILDELHHINTGKVSQRRSLRPYWTPKYTKEDVERLHLDMKEADIKRKEKVKDSQLQASAPKSEERTEDATAKLAADKDSVVVDRYTMKRLKEYRGLCEVTGIPVNLAEFEKWLAAKEDIEDEHAPFMIGFSGSYGGGESSRLNERLGQLEGELEKEKSSRTAAEKRLREEEKRRSEPKIHMRVGQYPRTMVHIGKNSYGPFESGQELTVFDEGEKYRIVYTDSYHTRSKSWEALVPIEIMITKERL